MSHFQSILCPVDFSDYSRRALGYAVSLGIHYHAKLLVQHVLAPTQTVYYGYMVPGTLRQDYEESIHKQAASVLAEFVAGTVGGRLPCEEVLSVGSATYEILSCAEEHTADLIVMGTHGRSGFERFILGSVTEKVIRKAKCPVLAVRELAHKPGPDASAEDLIHYRTILVPVDLTEHSTQTLEYAARLASEYKARLLVVHVLEHTKVPMVDPTYTTMLADYWKEVRAEAQRLMDDLVANLKRRSVAVTRGIPIEPLITAGKINDEILALARQEQADVVVMGAKSSWVAQIVSIGTTAHQVLSHAECPVMLLRGERRGKESAQLKAEEAITVP